MPFGRWSFGLVVLSLVAAACTSAGSPDTSTTAPPESTDASSTTVVAGGGPSTGTTGEDAPPLPVISTADPIVRAGQDLVVTVDPRYSGTVTLTYGDAEIASGALEGGSATLVVPADAAPGIYALGLDDPDLGEAFGAVTVVDGPSLLIAAPSWNRSEEAPAVTVTTFDVPSDTTVALELTDDAGTTYLVPHPIAGLAPIPFGLDPGEGIPRGTSTWELPAGFKGSVRAVADSADRLTIFADTSDEPRIASSEVRMRVCDEPTVVTGDLGSAGSVSAVWVTDRLESTSVETEDGAFALTVSPGPVMLTARRSDGPTAASPQVVRLRCGDVLDVGSLDEVVDTGPAPGTYLGDATLEDAFLFTAVGTGDVEFDHEGTVDCSVLPTGGIELRFDPASFDDTLSYELTIPEFAGTGEYEAELRIEDFLGGTEATGPARILIEQGRIEDLDAVGGEFTADYAGSLGAGTVEGRFTCVFITALETVAPTPGVPPVTGMFAAPFFQAGAQGDDEPCRTGFVWETGIEADTSIPLLESLVTRTVEAKLSRVEWLAMSDVRALLDLAAMRELLDPDGGMDNVYAVAGALNRDLLVTIDIGRLGESWIASVVAYDVYEGRAIYRNQYTASDRAGLYGSSVGEDLAEGLRKAGICGEVREKTVQVASGEQQEIVYEVVDLAGQVADAAIQGVTSACGVFEPSSGETSGGKFTTTFTGGDGGCTDEVTFVAKAESPVGEVTTERDAEKSTTSIVIPMFSYRYVIEYDGSTGYSGTGGSYESGSAFFRAESEGIFYVDPDFGMVIGAGDGRFVGGDPGLPCVILDFDTGQVIDRIQEWEMDGTYGVMMSGDITEGTPTGGGSISLVPVGYGISLTASYSDPDCFPEGTRSNETFSMITAWLFVGQTNLITGTFPDGFEMPFNGDGSRTKKSWPIVEGNGSGTITIEVWQEDDGAP